MLDEHTLLRLHTEQLSRNLAHLLPSPFPEQPQSNNNLVTFNANCQYSQQVQQFSLQDHYSLQTLENMKQNEHFISKGQLLEEQAKPPEDVISQQQQQHQIQIYNNKEHHLPNVANLQLVEESSCTSNMLNRRQSIIGTSQGYYQLEKRNHSNSRLRQSLKTFLTPSTNSPLLPMSPGLKQTANLAVINEDTYPLVTDSFNVHHRGSQNVKTCNKISQNAHQVKEISVKLLTFNQNKNISSGMQSPLTDCYSTALPSPLEQAKCSYYHNKADSEEKQFEVARSSTKSNLNQQNHKSDNNQQFKQKHQSSDLASSYFQRLVEFNQSVQNKKQEINLKNQAKLNHSKIHSRCSNSQKTELDKTKRASDQHISKNGLERSDNNNNTNNDTSDFVLEEAKIFSQDIPEYPRFLRKASLIAEIKKTASPQFYNSIEINSLLNNSYLATGSFPRMEASSDSNSCQDKIMESNKSDQSNFGKDEVPKDYAKRQNKKQKIGGALCIGMDFPLDQVQNAVKENVPYQGQYDENDQDNLGKSAVIEQKTPENSAGKQPKTRNSVRSILIDMSIPAIRNMDTRQSNSQQQAQSQSPETLKQYASQSKQKNSIYTSYLPNHYAFQEKNDEITSHNTLNPNTSLNLSHSPNKIERVLSSHNRLSYHTPTQLHQTSKQISQKQNCPQKDCQINSQKSKSKSPNNYKDTTNPLHKSTKQTPKQLPKEQCSSLTGIMREKTRNRLLSNGRYQSSPEKQEKVAAARRISQEKLHLSRQRIEQQNKQAALNVKEKQQIASNPELIEQGQPQRKKTPKRENLKSNVITATTLGIQQKQQHSSLASSLKVCQISPQKEHAVQALTQGEEIPNVHGILPTEQMTLNSDTSFTVFRRY